MCGPLGAQAVRPFLLECGAAVEQEKVRQGHVHPGLDRLAGPLRQQPRGHQPLQRLV